MKQVKRKTIVYVFLFALAVRLPAQTNLPKYQFGLSAGFLVYQGDLTPQRLGSFRTQQFALGLQAARLLSSTLSVRAQLLRGRLRGDESIYDSPEYRQQRGFRFSSPLTEFTGQLVWNPASRNYADKGLSPYLFAGTGFAFLRVQRDWSRINAGYFEGADDLWNGLAVDTARSTPRIIPVIPVGAGVSYFFSRRLGINAEASYRLGYTDYLDGFSRAANPSRKDHYLHYAVGILYRTGKKNTLDCPKIRY